MIGRRDGAVLRATVDGAVWIGHVRRADDADAFKLPAALVLRRAARRPARAPTPVAMPRRRRGWREIRYEERGDVGALHFAFYNGAMSTAQCERLDCASLRGDWRGRTRVLVLAGGPDFWSNGIHLNVIEAAAEPGRRVVAQHQRDERPRRTRSSRRPTS